MSFLHRAQCIGLSIGLTFALACMSTDALAAGDPVAGKDLTYTCSGCHGIAQYKNAYPQYNVPKISGQNYEYLVASLKAYKAGERTHPTMQAQATSFSDADIENIAAFLSELSEEK
jgi:cytochrome c553